MTTEDRLAADKWLDQLDTDAALKVMLDSQAEAIGALRTALPQITAAVQALHTRLASSDAGRLAYIGAGTSARIGVQDGAELLPTFGWPERRTAFIIAGGEAALLQPVENAEDNEQAVQADISRLSLGSDDCLIGLAASGRTPYTCAGIRAARHAGCLTVGISNNHEHAFNGRSRISDLSCHRCRSSGWVNTAKSRDSAKICLNLLSTQLMVLLGRVRHGLMTEMIPAQCQAESPSR